MILNKTRRLSVMVLTACVALLLAGCGTQPAAAQPSAAPAATTAATHASPATSAAPTTAATAGAMAMATSGSAPTSAATAEATTTGAATAGATSPTAGTSAGSAQDVTPKIVAAANAFLATLSDTEKDSVLFDWSDTTQKQRWSNLPEGLYERAGLMWGNISEAQQNAWLANGKLGEAKPPQTPPLGWVHRDKV